MQSGVGHCITGSGSVYLKLGLLECGACGRGLKGGEVVFCLASWLSRCVNIVYLCI